MKCVALVYTVSFYFTCACSLLIYQLTPPMIGQPVVSFTTSGEGMGSAGSSSPYTLPNLTVNDVYTFNFARVRSVSIDV